ncbi:MAG: magnesium and cobalt exporter, family [Verrucomicrobiota bacterium]|nr:magnesium and cobalt exporter, family [Verrucomicrobiota bacterium]
MNSLLFEIVVIFLLLLANGVFSMAEIAVVSARKSRLRQRAEQGDTRAKRALALAENPNTFLATVQIGITLVGVLAAAFGGASLADRLTGPLATIPWLAPYAEEVAFGAVVLVITYFTLVIGELVPKRIGLANPEGMARLAAGPMHTLSILCAPLVALLGRSTDVALAAFGIKPGPEAGVTEEDVRLLVREGMRAGVLHAQEPAMIEGVMSFDRRPVRDLMTPRAKIIWINAHDTHEVIWHRIVVSAHTTFPVYEGRRDNVIGMVTVKAIYANLAAGIPVNVRDLATPALFVPDSLPVNLLLEKFKATGKHVALATDEFGTVTGLVTLHDLLEAIVGDIPSPADRLKPKAVRREDGSWLVDGLLDAEEFTNLVSDFPLHPPAHRDYETFGGFVIKQLGHVPAEGETFRHEGYVVEVIDMDGLRVDKALLLPVKNLPAVGGKG